MLLEGGTGVFNVRVGDEREVIFVGGTPGVADGMDAQNYREEEVAEGGPTSYQCNRRAS
jgi:hypothetical protein